MKVRGDRVNITTKNVLYVPELCSNLLSVAAVTRTGKQVLFTKNKCFIKSGREVLATGVLSDGLWKLELNNCVASAAVSSELWHCRLGHLNVGYMDKMRSKIGSVNLNSECVTCSIGKIAKLPFPLSETRSEGYLDLVHTDVCGPMDVESLGVDDIS